MRKTKTLAVTALFACLMLTCEKSRNSSEGVSKCYERVTTGNGLTDRMTLNVEFVSDSVSGKLNWLPQEKDTQRGAIKGIKVSDEKYSVHYNYIAEGVKNTEKQTITFKKNMAIITREHESSNGANAFLSTDTLKLLPCSDAEKSIQK